MPQPIQHILVIRLSAMGDVAMTVPVLQQFLQQNHSVKITVVTDKFFTPLFAPLERTTVYGVDKKNTHKGFKGILKIYNDVKNTGIDAVADMHNVLRSKILRKLFLFKVKNISVIDKGRAEKKELTKKENKNLQQLKSGFERYAEVLRNLGFTIHLNNKLQVYSKRNIPTSLQSIVGKKIIIVAPFAQHEQKVYPLAKMRHLLDLLHENKNIQLLLLGGRNDKAVLDEWLQQLPDAINIAGTLSFDDELSLLSNADAVLSMDSANAHLASLFGVSVITVWGATHPYLGFYPWAQPVDNAAQIQLECRPCSVYGNKPCWRGDLACMHQLPEELILEKINKVLDI